MLRFHTPLIKPGGRISRTRLSDKACEMASHTRSPTNRCRDVRSSWYSPSFWCRYWSENRYLSLSPLLELRTQPLAHPIASVAVDVPVGFAHRPDAEVVGPAAKFAVDSTNQLLDVLPSLPSCRQLTDRATEPVDLLLRGTWSQVGLARSAVVVLTDGCNPENRPKPPAKAAEARSSAPSPPRFSLDIMVSHRGSCPLRR